MVLKKKKTKKSKKSKADGDKPEEEEKPKPMYEIPEYLDPAKYTPVCTLKLTLISPNWAHFSKSITVCFSCD
jgi:hypothetical protein